MIDVYSWRDIDYSSSPYTNQYIDLHELLGMQKAKTTELTAVQSLSFQCRPTLQSTVRLECLRWPRRMQRILFYSWFAVFELVREMLAIQRRPKFTPIIRTRPACATRTSCWRRKLRKIRSRLDYPSGSPHRSQTTLLHHVLHTISSYTMPHPRCKAPTECLTQAAFSFNSHATSGAPASTFAALSYAMLQRDLATCGVLWTSGRLSQAGNIMKTTRRVSWEVLYRSHRTGTPLRGLGG